MSPSPSPPTTLLRHITTLLSLSLSLLPFLPHARAAAAAAAAAPPQKRNANCNADNCLRELRQTRSSASPFCSSYLAAATVTVTVTPTIFSIYGSTMESHTVAAASTVPPATTTTTGASAMSTPTFASACTGAETRLSSACSCLLSGTQTAEGVTTTVTTTAPAISSTVCQPPTYGLVYKGGSFDNPYIPAPPAQQFSYPVFTSIHSNYSCCALCFGTPGCVTYIVAEALGGCDLEILDGSGVETVGDRLCPFGVLGDYAPDAGVGYGLGPCGYYVESNGVPINGW